MMENEYWQKLAPPALEMAFCEFMLDAIGDEALMSMTREFLPSKVFSHTFTQKLSDAWKKPGSNRSRMRLFYRSLGDSLHMVLFDEALKNKHKSFYSEMDDKSIMQNFIRNLWIEYIRRFRGAIPVCYDAKSIEFRMNLSSDLRRLATVSWSQVVEIVKRYNTNKEAPK